MKRVISRIGVCVVGALLLGSLPAQAQPGGQGDGGRRGDAGGFGGIGRERMDRMFDPSVTTPEIESYQQILTLTKDQKDAVSSLFEAYQSQFTDAAKAARDKLEAARTEAREGDNPDARRAVRDQATAFRKTSTEMETAFFNDVKAVLTPEQLERWPVIERTRRRERTMSRGLMSGERVDVLKLVDELELPAAAKADLAPTLEQYQVDLDRELAKRNEVYDSAQEKMRELFASGDMDQVDKLWEKGREASGRVRDVNKRYARQVEGMLPEDKREQFDQAVRRESFPLIYRPSYASRVVDAAAALPDLTEEQKATVTGIKETFSHDLTAVNRKLETVYETVETNMTPQRMMGGGWRDNPEIEPLREERRTLEDGVIEKVRAVLSEKQIDQLPERRAAGDDRRDRGGPPEEGNGPQQRRTRRARPQAPEQPERPPPV